MIAIREAELAEIRALSPKASCMQEANIAYVYMPDLVLPVGCDPAKTDALLRPEPGPDGYTTRLFLSHPFPAKGQNWTAHRILDKTWHTFSYNNVTPDLRLIEILINHLRVLR